MFKHLRLLFILFVLSGCAAKTQDTVFEPEPPTPPAINQVVPQMADLDPPVTLEVTGTQASALEEDAQETPEEPEVEGDPIGVVFAKTQFEGVLETSFVKLSIVSLDDPKKVFELQIGEKIAQQPFSFNVKSVKPGYFFIELPVGAYRFTSISIPVGGATATEPLDVWFEVLPDRINYLGTLRLIGTKEKIRLGGVPVIKPGFEYEAQVIDQFDEGIVNFQQRYPHISGTLTNQLMRINR